MKPFKYLLCIIFLLVYVVVGLVLRLLIATLAFLKSIPHVWGVMLGKKTKKQSILSNADMAEVLKGAEKRVIPEAWANEVEKLRLNPNDMWVSYLDRRGNG